jgi:hypothetical protein
MNIVFQLSMRKMAVGWKAPFSANLNVARNLLILSYAIRRDAGVHIVQRHSYCLSGFRVGGSLINPTFLSHIYILGVFYFATTEVSCLPNLFKSNKANLLSTVTSKFS